MSANIKQNAENANQTEKIAAQSSRDAQTSGEAVDKDLYDLPPKELKKIPTVCGSLRQALEELNKDRGFLKVGGVFDDDFIDAYVDLKMSEIIRFEHTPHPVEFEMYYSS